MKNRLRIPNVKGMYIDKDYNIFDSNGVKIPNTTSTHTYITINNRTKLKSLEWIYTLAKYNIGLPKGKEHLVFSYVFHNIKVRRDIDELYVVSPIPITFMVDGVAYRIIPRHPNYAISSDGVVINSNTLKPLNTYTKGKSLNPNTYVYTYLNSYGEKNYRPIHRLVGYAWLPNDDPYTKTLVNHLNGDKKDNRASNLEWESYKGNNKHAVDIGLRDDNIFTMSRCIKTKDIVAHSSITDLCKHIGRSTITSSGEFELDRLYKGSNGVFEIRLGSDLSSWEEAITVSNVVIDGKIIPIRDVKELIRLIPDSEVSNRLLTNNTRYSYNTILGVLKKYYKDLKHTIIKNRTDGVFLARNIKTNETVSDSTIASLAEIVGVAKSSATKSVKYGGIYVYNDWQFKLDNGKPFPKPIKVANKPKSVCVLNVSTGVEKYYPSLRQAGVALNADKRSVSIAMYNKTILNGHRVY